MNCLSGHSHAWLCRVIFHNLEVKNEISPSIVLLKTHAGHSDRSYNQRLRKIVSDRNNTLGEGNTISGTLFLLSNNAILEKDTTVEGSVIMICCNLTVGGDLNGDIFLLTGNLKIDVYADVSGDVNVMSGNVSR